MKLNLLIAILSSLLFIEVHTSNEVFTSEFKETLINSFMKRSPKELFKIYHLLYHKLYDLNSDEGIKRFEIFMNNVNFIEETNSQNLSYKLGINNFSDLTNEEFRNLYLGLKDDFDENLSLLYNSNAELVSSTDFIEENHLTEEKLNAGINYSNYFGPIKDQGICGSCYSFVSTGTIEGNYAKFIGDNLRFSEQHIVDCSTYTYGCNGGDPRSSFKYITEKGLAYEIAYPYTSGITGKVGTCKYSQITPNFVLNGTKYCTPSSCTRSKVKSLLSSGPIFAAIDGGARTFQSYKSGIIDNMSCDSLTHAIIMTGNDFDSNNREYYRGRNSWGTDWGEKGYFRIYLRDSDKTCFMESFVVLPIVKETFVPVPPSPVPDCLKIYSQCDLKGTEVSICKSSPNLSIDPAGFTIGKFSKANFYLNTNCSGSYYSLTKSIPCFADSGITASLNSIFIDNGLDPPSGCIWVYNGYCLTGSEKREICSSTSDLSALGFSNVISSIKIGAGIVNIRAYINIGYSGGYATITTDKVSLFGSTLDKNIESIKFNA